MSGGTLNERQQHILMKRRERYIYGRMMDWQGSRLQLVGGSVRFRLRYHEPSLIPTTHLEALSSFSYLFVMSRGCSIEHYLATRVIYFAS
jgi:hypothetical protein